MAKKKIKSTNKRKQLDKSEKTYLKLLGDRVEKVRKAKGFTQVQIAEKLGTEHAQIGRLERGLTNASVIVLRRIATELGITVSELLNFEENETPSIKNN